MCMNSSTYFARCCSSINLNITNISYVSYNRLWQGWDQMNTDWQSAVEVGTDGLGDESMPDIWQWKLEPRIWRGLPAWPDNMWHVGTPSLFIIYKFTGTEVHGKNVDKNIDNFPNLTTSTVLQILYAVLLAWHDADWQVGTPILHKYTVKNWIII